jgi:hypothetical protein
MDRAQNLFSMAQNAVSTEDWQISGLPDPVRIDPLLDLRPAHQL